MLTVKNWHTFQHFKDRCPPWIKLHKSILDQRDINAISDGAFRVLVSCWLIASEDKEMKGRIESIDDIAFRMRVDKSKVDKALRELESFLIQDDIKTISDRYRDDAPETETEAETKEEKSRAAFELFWQAYPSHRRKTGQDKCLRLWLRMGLGSISDKVMQGLEWWKSCKDWTKDNGEYICGPHVWLNEARWEVCTKQNKSADPYAHCDPFNLMPTVEYEREQRLKAEAAK